MEFTGFMNNFRCVFYLAVLLYIFSVRLNRFLSLRFRKGLFCGRRNPRTQGAERKQRSAGELRLQGVEVTLKDLKRKRNEHARTLPFASSLGSMYNFPRSNGCAGKHLMAKTRGHLVRMQWFHVFLKRMMTLGVINVYHSLLHVFSPFLHSCGRIAEKVFVRRCYMLEKSSGTATHQDAALSPDMNLFFFACFKSFRDCSQTAHRKRGEERSQRREEVLQVLVKVCVITRALSSRQAFWLRTDLLFVEKIMLVTMLGQIFCCF